MENQNKPGILPLVERPVFEAKIEKVNRTSKKCSLVMEVSEMDARRLSLGSFKVTLDPMQASLFDESFVEE